MQEPRQPACGERDQHAQHPRAGHVRAPHGEEGAHEHHPLEPDVHDARTLGEQAAERCEREWRRVAQHRGEQRAPDDDRVELRRARLRREVPDQETKQPRCDRVATDPALAAHQPESQSERDREQADRDRERRAARTDGRQRDECCADANRDGPKAEPARSPRNRHHAGAFLERPRRSQPSITRMSTSAPTKSTTRPWMITAMLPPTPGAKMVGSRFRDAIPVWSAAKRSADNPTPTAVFRPSSATAMPMKPMFVPWIVVMSTRYCQPRMSSEPASPANSPAIAIARK